MKKFSLFLSFIMAAILFSCKPSVPSRYIQPGDFEDLIYDLHIADAMSIDENGEVYECPIKPFRASDKTLLNMLMR